LLTYTFELKVRRTTLAIYLLRGKVIFQSIVALTIPHGMIKLLMLWFLFSS